MNLFCALMSLALANEATHFEGEYHSDLDYSEVQQSRLEWYLPISANLSFGFHPTHEMLVISTEYSIAGINITDGAYKYNSTFRSRSVCTKLVDERLVTLSDTNHVGQWTTMDGIGTDWLQISTESDPKTESYCDIVSPTPDLTVVLHHGKQIICLDQEGSELWKWTALEPNTLITKLEYTQDYIVAIGIHNGRLLSYDFGIDDGHANTTMGASIPIKGIPEFVVVGQSPLYIVWEEENQIHGYIVDHDMELDFSVLAGDIDHFDKAPKRIIGLDTEFHKRSEFIIEYQHDNQYHYVLARLVMDDSHSTMAYHLLAPVQSIHLVTSS
jgi:hypothetical protein